MSNNIVTSTKYIQLYCSLRDKIAVIDRIIYTPVVRPAYGVASNRWGFLMQILHRIYLFVALDLPKETDLLLNLPHLPNYEKWRCGKLNHYVVKNIHSDLLQEFIHTEVYFLRIPKIKNKTFLSR